MPIAKWSPLGFLSGRFGWPGPARWLGLEEMMRMPAAEWWPNMDVYSKGKDLVIRVEVPGASPEDIAVDLAENQLTISGKRVHEEEVKEDDYYRRECSFGSFCRTIPLPKEVKEKDISAKLKDGVLEVVVKGAGSMAPPKKRIPIEKAD